MSKDQKKQNSECYASEPRNKETILEDIKESYVNAIGHFKDNDFSKAEEEFVKTIKPALSKPLKKEIIMADCPRDIKEMLLDSMNHLGMIYLNNEHVKQCGYTNNYAKAAMIFQYCAKFTEKYQDEIDSWQEKKIFFLSKANQVEFEFLKTLGKENEYSSEEQIARMSKYQKLLSELRIETKQELTEKINPFGVDKIAERTKRVEDLYTRITKFFVNHNDASSSSSSATTLSAPGLLNQLLEECYSQLAQKPEGCEFAVIGLGSLAGGKMTPYSDLEFAILVNEDRPEYKEYLQNVTKLLHIKVINYFQESVIRSLGIESLNNFRTANDADDWFWDDVNAPGFSFDGPQWYSGKLPFGRKGYKAKEKIKNENGAEQEIIVKKPDFDLVLTPQQMAGFQAEINNIDEVSFKTDPRLVQAVRHISLIDGNQMLVNEYRQKLTTAVDQEVVKKRSLQILKENLKDFELKLGDEEEGKLFDVKKDIYRLSDRIIDSLCDYYGIKAGKNHTDFTIWRKIQALQDNNHLNKEGAQHLKEAVSIATELRLATYLHNKSQQEGMSTYVPVVEHLDEEYQKVLLEKTLCTQEYYKENGTKILHHFCYVLIPLQQVIHNNSHQPMLNFSNNKLFNNSYFNQGLVHRRFLEYIDVQKKCDKIEEEYKSNNNIAIFNFLMLLYPKMNDTDKAIKWIEVYKCSEESFDFTVLRNSLGVALRKQEDYDGASEHHNVALKSRQRMYDRNPSTKMEEAIANTHCCLGAVYNMLESFAEATKHYNEAIEHYKHVKEYYQKDPEHHIHAIDKSYINIARSHHGLGNAYSNACSDAQYKKEAENCFNNAAENYDKALKIMKKTYKNTPNHPDIAQVYYGLGTLLSHNKDESLDNLDKAISYHQTALKIRKIIYSTITNHPDIISSYYQLGVAYYKNKCYKRAEELLLDAIKLYQNASRDHVGALHCLGEVYYAMSPSNEEAMQYMWRAFDMSKKLIQGSKSKKQIEQLTDTQKKIEQSMKVAIKSFIVAQGSVTEGITNEQQSCKFLNDLELISECYLNLDEEKPFLTYLIDAQNSPAVKLLATEEGQDSSI